MLMTLFFVFVPGFTRPARFTGSEGNPENPRPIIADNSLVLNGKRMAVSVHRAQVYLRPLPASALSPVLNVLLLVFSLHLTQGDLGADNDIEA
jgi:hypothetical protein